MIYKSSFLHFFNFAIICSHLQPSLRFFSKCTLLDKLKYEIKFRYSMKCVGILFSIFSLYLLLPSESKAETLIFVAYPTIFQVEYQDSHFATIHFPKSCALKIESLKSKSWYSIIINPFRIFEHKKYLTNFSSLYQVITAKKFLIRSGLSPPSVFA